MFVLSTQKTNFIFNWMVSLTTGFASSASPEVPEPKSSDDLFEDLDARATPIEDLTYHTFKIEEYNEDELPELPWGFHTPGLGGHEEETFKKYTVNPEVNGGKYDLFIAGLDPQNGQNVSKIVPTITQFLGGGTHQNTVYKGAIATVGDLPLKELSGRYSSSAVKNPNTAKLFETAWMADIATMMIGVRLATKNGRDVAVDQECPQGRDCQLGPKTKCRTMISLNDLEIKYAKFKSEPLFKVTLEDGFSDGESWVKHVFISPLKFKQINEFFGGAKIPDFETMKAAITAIPESTVYGKKRGTIFCKELYEAMTIDDIDLVREAITAIDAGPKLILDVECACGQMNFPYQLPLFRNPRIFLYMTKKLGKERE